MRTSAELIVLGTTRTGEKALVVHTLSREWGRRGFIVRPGKNTPPSLFLPLSIIEADIVSNPKSSLWSMSGVSLSDPLDGIRGNIYKNTMSLFISELLFRTLRDGILEDGLYEWCVREILMLDALEGDFSSFHLLFVLGFAGALGFRPTWQDILPFAGESALPLKDLVEKPYSEALLVPLSGESRSAILNILISYLEFHTDQTLHLKSLPVLHDLYSSSK